MTILLSLARAAKRIRNDLAVWRGAVIGFAALVGLAVLLSGVAIGLDRQLQSWRDAIRSHSASGRLVFVEIDARSLAALDHWPWPRSLYSQAIRTLDRAGAAAIALDVDFSARSSAAEDRAFAAAVAASRAPVLLPTFRQPASEHSGGVVESLPRDSFRDRALLGTVNIFPDGDGLVRSYPYGLATGGMPRPSLGALMAGTSGQINRSFPVDGAIDPATVPRISFIDLIRDRVPAGLVQGKTLLIGATAIELGDRYPVPRHGVISGGLIQLLAAETLMQDSMPTNLGGLVPLVLVIVALPLVLRRTGRQRRLAFCGVAALLLLLPLGLEWASLGTMRIGPALIALLSAAGAAAIADAVRAARVARTIDFDTGLPNRRALAEAIAGDVPHTLAALRVQSFGDILGVMGRARAAELMTRVAERLALAVDRPIYLVEENALAWAIDDAEPADTLEPISALLRPGIEIAGRRLELKASFGLATVQAADPVDAVGRALLAAERASLSGARWQRHDEALDRERDWQLTLVSEVDQALAEGQIWVAYQPKLDLATNRIHAAEALARWIHPERGAISPAQFIPVLEASGKILEVTLHVLGRALADLRGWLDAGLDVHVAVNVSALLPADPHFPAAVERLLAEHCVPAHMLTLEVTESVSLADPDAAIASLERLSAIGIKLSIDDYGTGQSTLSYLKRLPAREIKIDQSFVRTLDQSRADQAMVRSTIELAHELGFAVVAEGIENEAVLDLLRGYGCDVAQGWLIGRPVPADQFETLLKPAARRVA